MLDALVNGEVIEPELVADLAIGRLRGKIPDLIRALNGRVTLHHRSIIKRSLDHLKFLETAIADIEADMERYFAPYKEKEELLQTIPGVGPNAARIIIAEIGADMSVFPSASHLASWAGISPGNNESAGKKKSTRTTRGNKALKSVLVEAAWAASKTRTYLGSKYWSIAGRKDKKRAVVAIGHKILVICYHVLQTGKPYSELGADYLEKRKPISTEEMMIRRLNKKGYVVVRPDEATA